MRYILWVSALLGACDVNQDGGFAKLDFIEIVKKWQKLEIFVLDMFNIASLNTSLVLFSRKKAEKHAFLSKKGFTTCYL